MSSEDTTKGMDDARSFQERIFSQLNEISSRLQSVESKVEQRMYDTKPIWERALKELMDANQHLESLERKMDVLGKDMLTLRADQLGIERRVSRLEDREGGGLLTIG